jgi:hypothetical protein
MGKGIMRFREGCPTKNDINLVNSRVVTSKVILPLYLLYGTYFNTLRDTINTGVVRKSLKQKKHAFYCLEISFGHIMQQT